VLLKPLRISNIIALLNFCKNASMGLRKNGSAQESDEAFRKVA